MENGKKCSICKAVQPVVNFCRKPSATDGLNDHCRKCKQAYDKRRRARPEYKERKKLLTKRRRAELTAAQTYPDLIKKRCTQCKTVKPIDGFALSRRMFNGRRGQCRECTNAYERQLRRRRLAENPIAIKAKCFLNKKLRGNRNPETIEYTKILLLDACSYCGKRAGTIDHIVAVANSGGTEWHNLTAACLSCNASKQDRSVLDFLGFIREKAILSDQLEQAGRGR